MDIKLNLLKHYFQQKFMFMNKLPELYNNCKILGLVSYGMGHPLQNTDIISLKPRLHLSLATLSSSSSQKQHQSSPTKSQNCQDAEQQSSVC